MKKFIAIEAINADSKGYSKYEARGDVIILDPAFQGFNILVIVKVYDKTRFNGYVIDLENDFVNKFNSLNARAGYNNLITKKDIEDYSKIKIKYNQIVRNLNLDKLMD